MKRHVLSLYFAPTPPASHAFPHEFSSILYVWNHNQCDSNSSTAHRASDHTLGPPRHLHAAHRTFTTHTARRCGCLIGFGLRLATKVSVSFISEATDAGRLVAAKELGKLVEAGLLLERASRPELTDLGAPIRPSLVMFCGAIVAEGRVLRPRDQLVGSDHLGRCFHPFSPLIIGL